MRLLSLFRYGTFCLSSVMAFSSAGFLSPALIAQSQNNASVAEAARKAKEQKKSNPKESLVITEETLTLRPASADTGEAPPAGTVINTTPVPLAPEAPPPAAPDEAKKPEDSASAPAAEPAKSPESPSTPASAPAAPAEAGSAPPAEPPKSPESSSPAPGTDTAAPAADDAKKAEEQAAEIAKTKEMLAQALSELDLAKRELALQNDTYYSNPDYVHDTAGKTKIDDMQRTIDEKQTSALELKQRLEQLMQEAGVSPEVGQTPAVPMP